MSNSRLQRGVCFVFTVMALSALMSGASLRAQETASGTGPACSAQGWTQEQARDYLSAGKSYREGLKQAGQGAACYESLYRVAMLREDYKAAADVGSQFAKASADPADKARGALLAGRAEYRAYFASLNGEGGAEKSPRHATDALKRAEKALADGLAAAPNDEPLRFLHARVLAAMKRDEDASREFKACAAMPGATPEQCARALRLASNVEAARSEPAAAFTAQAVDGKSVSLASLSGKVVLIDFWATWCTYCQRDSDYVQSMLDSFDASKFALVEVNVDDNEDLWRRYVKDNRLDGLQVHDLDNRMRDAFHVTAYPTYLILDGDGNVRYRISGARGDLRGDIRQLINEQAGPRSAGAALSKPAE